MTVVSNTSPPNYLVLIEHQDILPALLERVLVPEAVWQELRSPAAPSLVKSWLDTQPGWLERRAVSRIPPELEPLDAGEREAIALALAEAGNLVLLDERKGRRAARALGLAVAGTVGILQLAARRGLVELASAFKRLERTNFRATPRLLRNIP